MEKEELTLDDILYWFDEYRSEHGEEPLEDGIYFENQEVIVRDFIRKNYPETELDEGFKDIFMKDEEDLFIEDILECFCNWYWSSVMKSTDYNDLPTANLEAEKVYAQAAIDAGMGEDIINQIQNS